jgi:penicillin-binding protein 2
MLYGKWPNDERRDRYILGVVFAFFGLLIIRLFMLQIVGSERYRMMSDDNRIETVPLEAPRGSIFDRNGEVLADSHPAYQIVILPSRRETMLHTTRELGMLLHIDIAQAETEILKRVTGEQQMIRIKRDATFAEVSMVEEHRDELPGVEIQIETKRSYPFSTIACHVLGYIGEMTQEEAPKFSSQGYLYGQMVGRKGIEAHYENLLKGVNGEEYLEVNALGRRVGSFPERLKKPQPGLNLWLTIDGRLQEAAEEAFPDSTAGSLVALNPYNGEILALVSKPGFDPNIFVSGLSHKAWKQLREAENNPLMNRVVQSAYPPGSTLKMLTAITGLESGLLDPYASHFAACTGGMMFGNRFYRCWRKGGHGSLNMHEAITQSCDVFFYQLGRRIGVASWSRYAGLLGLGEKTGIDLDSEVSGLVPTPQYYDRRYGEKHWTSGVMLNLAIGQGEVLATPIQMARYIAAIGTGGYLCEPHLLMKIEGRQPETKPSVRMNRISPMAWFPIKHALLAVVEHGTGRQAHIEGIHVAGKTGTAQNPQGEDHAWFVGFAPYEHPEIAVAAIVENAGHGGSVAAPVVKEVIETYLREIWKPEHPSIAWGTIDDNIDRQTR